VLNLCSVRRSYKKLSHLLESVQFQWNLNNLIWKDSNSTLTRHIGSQSNMLLLNKAIRCYLLISRGKTKRERKANKRGRCGIWFSIIWFNNLCQPVHCALMMCNLNWRWIWTTLHSLHTLPLHHIIIHLLLKWTFYKTLLNANLARLTRINMTISVDLA